MYKNQLQELAQRSCFNLPSYACIREGPDHAPRFKASVNFNGEVFEGPSYCSTLRQAEHAAAEVALTNLSSRGPSKSLAARVLDETGVYKNLLQETAHRAGLRLPVYTTVRSGPGHQPVFTCSVELAGMSFSGEPAKTKKQAEKNAAMAAWSALKQMPNLESFSLQAKEAESGEEQEQVVVARVLSNFKPNEESRPVRQREQQQQYQQQQRRRMVVGYREGGSGSFNNSLRYHRLWKPSDPSSDASPLMFSAQYHQRQSSLLALPPPSGSKILPPTLPLLQHSCTTSPEPSPSKDKNSTTPFIYSSNNPSPLEEHQKNGGEEVIKLMSDAKGKAMEREREPQNARPTPAFTPVPPYLRAVPPQSSSGLAAARMQDQRAQRTLIRTRPFSPPPHAPVHPPIGTASVRNLSAMPVIPRMISSGGFHRPGLAPAVQVRSVIPVCAAPPMRPSANTKEINKKDAEVEVSAATSKLNKMQL